MLSVDGVCTIKVVSGGPASAHIKILIKFDEMDRGMDRVCADRDFSREHKNQII